MRRSIKNTGEILVKQNELVFFVNSHQLETWICEIGLLIEGLVEQVTCFTVKSKFMLQKGHKDACKSNCVVKKNDSGEYKFILPQNQLEYFQSVLLRFYRDSAAEANHIHLYGKQDDCPYNLTVAFDQVKPPMTAEQMQKHIEKLEQG
ncbi:MAG: hypothetical protein OXT67_03600 [Zetaproteobacteria bacterium]|nr:hypothetical protein [Zetaproteobacteria bacterium]